MSGGLEILGQGSLIERAPVFKRESKLAVGANVDILIAPATGRGTLQPVGGFLS